MKDIYDLIARILISLIFLYEAYDSIFFMKATKVIMTDYGITWNQNFLFFSAIFLLVIGSLMVILGYRTSVGATMLLLYWLPLTFIVHSFWNDPEDIRRMQSILFMKNMAIIGGLLMIIVNGSGKYSIKKLFATTKVYKKG